MPATVYLITGGARSGKSSYAERLCLDLCPENPLFLATGPRGNDDPSFERRIAQHQARRGPEWTTIEEPLRPSQHVEQFTTRVVLLDCITLWLTNLMMDEGAFALTENGESTTNKTEDLEDTQLTAATNRATDRLKDEMKSLMEPYNCTYVIVTNEVGSGMHGSSPVARAFGDAQGWINQWIAEQAYQVVHMVCGIPSVLKTAGGVTHTNTANLKAQRLDRYLSTRSMPLDSKGYFLVRLDRPAGRIVASFHSCTLNADGDVCDLDGKKIPCHGTSPAPLRTWSCRTAKELMVEIFERWESISAVGCSPGHAAYMGREAQKAEHALLHQDPSKVADYGQD